MDDILPFSPFAPTVNINVSASSQRVQIHTESGPVNVRIMNNGSATVWCAFGDATVVATTASGFPVGPGVTEVLLGEVNTVGGGPLNVAAIAAGATGNIYFTIGRGI